MKKIISFIVAVFSVLSLCSLSAFAVNEPTALGIGFEVDASQVKKVGWFNEQMKGLYVTDITGTTHLACTIRMKGVVNTSNARYYGNYREDNHMTKIVVEPQVVTSYVYAQSGFWIFTTKHSTNMQFFLSTMTEKMPIPQGLAMSAHMSTSPAIQEVASVTDSWTIGGSGNLSYKALKIGLGKTWSQSVTSSINLASLYDSSRNSSKYEVKYTFMSPLSKDYTKLTYNQMNYLRTQCVFYSSKSLYGMDSAMASYVLSESATVTVFSQFNNPNSTSSNTLSHGGTPETVSASGTLTVSVRYY